MFIMQEKFFISFHYIFETIPKEQEDGQTHHDHFLVINHIHKHFPNIRLRLLGASWLAISGKVTTLSAETLLSDGRDSETGSGCAKRGPES